MMVDIPPVSGVSWKDKLLGRRGPGPSDGANDMDLEIEDGDILRSTINGYGVLHNRIYSLLEPSQPFRLMDVENGYYLVQFQNRDDYDMALTQGPWIVFRHYLTVQPWTVDFDPQDLFQVRLWLGSAFWAC
ncbi:hypothetical protein Gotur_023803 [Gossypium turneri]